MGYNPTVTNAKVSEALNARIGFTTDEQKKLLNMDYDYVNKNDVDLKDWWDKVLKS
jgi:putative spermidine/putrescine transport system substrate-binding protein